MSDPINDPIKINHASFDGSESARIAHGRDCVAIILKDDAIVFSALQALAFADDIIAQAEDAEWLEQQEQESRLQD